MSDLIDLNACAENTKKPTLVEPLIPLPENPSLEISDSSVKYVDDNPFDQALKESNKNLRKMLDPFEMVMEKARRSKSDSDVSDLSQSIPESFIKRSNSSKKFTSQNSLKSFQVVNSSTFQVPEINVFSPDSNESLISSNLPKLGELSILDESAMNDTLSDCVFSDNNNSKEKFFAGLASPLPKIRSFSQPNAHLSPQVILEQLSNSLLEPKMKPMNGSASSSIASIFFNDTFNKGFMESTSLSGISNISSISVLSKISSTGSTYSNGPLNQAFIESTTWARTEAVSENLDSSNDSVFESDLNEMRNKSIMKEARSLSRIFQNIEDIQNISSDDLLSVQPPWECQDLPQLEDEVEVDNLIAFSNSPRNERSGNRSGSCEASESKICHSVADAEVEELLNFQDPKKKSAAMTILVELKNFAENRPEAVKLLSDLESMLGLKCESNMELLTACMQSSNDSSRGSQKDCDSKEEKDMVVDSTTDTVEEKLDLSIKDDENSDEEPREKTAQDLLQNLETIIDEPSLVSLTTEALKELKTILSKIVDSKIKKENDGKPEVDDAKRNLRPPKYQGRKSFQYEPKLKPPMSGKTARRSSSLENNRQKMSPSFSKICSAESADKKKTDSAQVLKKAKQGITEKPGLITSVHKGKLVTEIVKTKLKKKTGTEIAAHKGPMKAVLPLSTMHKQKILLAAFDPNKRASTRRSLMLPSQPKGTSTPKDIPTKEVKKRSSPVAMSTPVEKKCPAKNSGEIFYDSTPIAQNVTNKTAKQDFLKTPSPNRNAKNRRSTGSMLPRMSPRKIASPLRTNNQNVQVKTFNVVPKGRFVGEVKIAEKENVH